MKLAHFALAALALLPLNAFAQAEYCSYIDNSAPLGEVRNQGNVGWCYANASADLLSYRMRNELGNQKLSAIFMALANNSFIRPSADSQAGTMRLSIEFGARVHGLCLQSVEDQVMGMGPIHSIAEKVDAAIELKQLYNQGQKAGSLTNLHSKLEAYEKAGSILGTIPRGDLMRVFAGSDEKTFPLNLAKLICKGHTVSFPAGIDVDSRVGFFGITVGTPLMRMIDRKLNEGNVVGIGYFANFLTSDNGRKEGGHASVIVGRKRAADGTCLYKLRNSWGPGCYGYKAKYNTPERCERGNLWVEEAELNSNLTAITYID
ncbi:MAG: hypothetical protein ABL958_21155 [Bdellovibrionia bacterium]